METVIYTKKLTVKKHYDVIVCGGGVAGVAAAVSAAKNGCSTLLIEKSNIQPKTSYQFDFPNIHKLMHLSYYVF